MKMYPCIKYGSKKSLILLIRIIIYDTPKASKYSRNNVIVTLNVTAAELESLR